MAPNTDAEKIFTIIVMLIGCESINNNGSVQRNFIRELEKLFLKSGLIDNNHKKNFNTRLLKLF